MKKSEANFSWVLSSNYTIVNRIISHRKSLPRWERIKVRVRVEIAAHLSGARNDALSLLLRG